MVDHGSFAALGVRSNANDGEGRTTPGHAQVSVRPTLVEHPEFASGLVNDGHGDTNHQRVSAPTS